MADFLRLIDVNSGGSWLKKGQGILHPTSMAPPPKMRKEKLQKPLFLGVGLWKGILYFFLPNSPGFSLLGRFPGPLKEKQGHKTSDFASPAPCSTIFSLPPPFKTLTGMKNCLSGSDRQKNLGKSTKTEQFYRIMLGKFRREKSIHQRCLQLSKLKSLNTQKRGLVYTKKLVFKGKRRKIHIHQRAFKVVVRDPVAQYRRVHQDYTHS